MKTINFRPYLLPCLSGALFLFRGQMKFRADEEVLMGLLPFYHIYGLMVLQFGTLTQGAKLIVVPKFEPETFLTAIEEYKVTECQIRCVK